MQPRTPCFAVPFRSTLLWFLFTGLLVSTIARMVSAAGPPDPANSSIPTHIYLVGMTSSVPDPQGTFSVHVADANGDDCAGVVVTLNFSGAPDLSVSTTQPFAGLSVTCTPLTVSATTGPTGGVSFNIVGGVSNQSGTWSSSASTATITAGTTLLGTTRISAFDLDGLNGVTTSDAHYLAEHLNESANPNDAPGYTDYDGTGFVGNGLNPGDLSLMITKMLSHISLESGPLCSGLTGPGVLEVPASIALAIMDCEQTTGYNGNFCAAGANTYTDIVASVTMPANWADVNGVEAEFRVSAPGIQPFWLFQGSGCTSPTLTLLTDPTTFVGGCLESEPLFVGQVGAGHGGVRRDWDPPTLPNDEYFRVAFALHTPGYFGPGIPGSSGPCNFDDFPDLALNTTTKLFSLRVRHNNATCAGCAQAITLTLDKVKFTTLMPGDPSRYIQGQCPAPNVVHETNSVNGPGNPADILTLIPDGSGSNVIMLNNGVVGVPGGAETRHLSWLAPVLPSPASGSMTIRYGLPSARIVRLAVVDVAGRQVRMIARGMTEAGEHTETWDGRDESGRLVSGGMYYCRLVTEDGPLTRAVVLRR